MFRSHRSKINSRVLAGVLSAAAALTLVGCSSGSSATPTDSATSGSITWWGWAPDVTVGDRYITEFNKVYPNIKVTYKNFEGSAYNGALRPGLTSSAGPDVYNMAPGGNNGEFAAFGKSGADLTPAVVKQFGNDWKSQYAFSNDALTTKSGTLAGIALGGVAAGFVWVDQDLFDKYGLKVPTTYSQWVDVCKAFKANNISCFTMGSGGDTQLAVETLRTVTSSVKPGYFMDAVKGDASWDDPTFVQGLTLLKQMKTDGIIPADTLGLQQYPDANNAFMSQKAAMVQMGTWYAQYTRLDGATTAMEAAGVSNPKPFIMLPATFPDVAGKGNPSTYIGELDYGLGVSAKSKSKNAATTFVMWLTSSKEGQQNVVNAIDLVPSLKGVEPDWTNIKLVNQNVQQPALQDMFAKAASATESRSQFISAPAYQALSVAMTSVLEGTATPEQAATTMQSTMAKK